MYKYIVLSLSIVALSACAMEQKATLQDLYQKLEKIEAQYQELQQMKKEADALVLEDEKDANAELEAFLKIDNRNIESYFKALKGSKDSVAMQKEVNVLLAACKREKQRIEAEFTELIEKEQRRSEESRLSEAAIKKIQDEDFARKLQQKEDAKLAQDLAKQLNKPKNK